MTNHEKEMKEFLLKHLRQISYKWPYRDNARRHAWLRRGFYLCAKCSQETPSKLIALDHIEPVQDINMKNPTFDEWLVSYVKRLLCKEEGFQVLCKADHQIKTNEENKRRRK